MEKMGIEWDCYFRNLTLALSIPTSNIGSTNDVHLGRDCPFV